VKINIIGGGPAGLYFAILMKRADASHDIDVYERNGPNDTFGWGVVFSGKTLAHLKEADESTHQRITTAFAAWDNVDVVHRDEKISIHGNSFSGISRLQLLNILQERSTDLGINLHFNTEVSNVEELASQSDLLIGSDGVNSTVRELYKEWFLPSLNLRSNKYIWYGTNQLFHGLTLTFREKDGAVFAAHSYKFNETTSTFIIECDPESWSSSGFTTMDEAETRAHLETVFAADLNGHPLLSNNSKWINFLNVKNANWSHGNIVMLGDALHTAHFSIGSGTKLALEDSIALKQCFDRTSDVTSALRAFEEVRKPIIEEYQAAALESCVWFENARQYMNMSPIELAYMIMTRSGRVDDESLRRRDPAFMARVEMERSSRCFRAGTLVKTSEGWKAIEKIRIGELVWTHRNRLRNVVGLQIRPHSGRIVGLRVTGSSRIVWLTPDHRILVPYSPSPLGERGLGGEVDGDESSPPFSSLRTRKGTSACVQDRLGGTSGYLISSARALRHDETKAETLLWQYLRARKLGGAKFRRQHPLGPNYIVDFYCSEAKLAIELDGTVHNGRKAQWADGIRQRQLQMAGVRVLRFPNRRVFIDLKSVLDEIKQHLDSPVTVSGESWRMAGSLNNGDKVLLDEQMSLAVIEQVDWLFVTETVYDLTVDSDHSFITECGVVHNCE